LPYVHRDGRPGHSTYRALPLLQETLYAERRNRSYTPYSAQSGGLVARLRPTDCNDRFELLYWSLWKNQWAPAGPFGRTVLSIDDALRFIAPGGYLLVYDVTARQMELRKVELRAAMITSARP
jgi:hypothetical protein